MADIQHIFRGYGAPLFAPSDSAHHYVDTLNKEAYLSVGSATPSDWIKVQNAGTSVFSVNGRVGIVTLTSVDVGLGNVDNTSDVNKPISTATAAALSGKYSISNPAGYVDASDASAAAPVQSVAGRIGIVTLTKSDVGLSNVDNTSDVNKPISTATQTALNLKYDASNPNVYVNAAGASAAAPVQSVAGRTGAVTLTKSDVGLTNVDNTSDVNKPVSTAQATAIGLKADKTITISTTAPLTGGGDLSASRPLSIPVATTSQSGYLSSTDWNTFNNKAGKLVPSRAVTADTTATISDYFIASDATIPINITLPNPVGNDGLELWIKRRGTGAVTVVGTMDGGTNAVMNQPAGYESIYLIAQGGLWNIG